MSYIYSHIEKCPLCGGELNYREAFGHWEHRTYEEEGNWVEDYYEYECRECGKIVKTETKVL